MVWLELDLAGGDAYGWLVLMEESLACSSTNGEFAEETEHSSVELRHCEGKQNKNRWTRASKRRVGTNRT